MKFWVLALALLMAGPASAMDFSFFTTKADGDVLVGIGDIVEGDAERAEQLIVDRRPLLVILNSNGGSLGVGLLLGHIFDRLGVMTLVPEKGGCYSACAYAFFGGKERYVMGKLGVHQMSFTSNKVSLDQAVSMSQLATAELFSFIRHKQISPQVMEIALSVGADDIHEFTKEELVSLNIVSALIDESEYADKGELDASQSQDGEGLFYHVSGLRSDTPYRNFLALRSGPGTQYPILAEMYENTLVEVFGSKGAWFHVRTIDGAVGYASPQWLVEGYPN